MLIAFCAGFAAGVISTLLLLVVVVIVGDLLEQTEQAERSRLAVWPFRRNNVVKFKRKDEP
jgi:hypothetical protein